MIEVTRLPQLKGGFLWTGLVGYRTPGSAIGAVFPVWNDDKPKFPSEVASQINDLISQNYGSTLTAESIVVLSYIDWDDEPVFLDVPLLSICTFPEFDFPTI